MAINNITLHHHNITIDSENPTEQIFKNFIKKTYLMFKTVRKN